MLSCVEQEQSFVILGPGFLMARPSCTSQSASVVKNNMIRFIFQFPSSARIMSKLSKIYSLSISHKDH